MNTWTTYRRIEPTDDEAQDIELLGSGMVQRDGQYICLLAQTDTETIWGIEDQNGDLMVAEVSSIPLAQREAIADMFDIVDDCYVGSFIVATSDADLRQRVSEIVA